MQFRFKSEPQVKLFCKITRIKCLICQFCEERNWRFDINVEKY